jgi:hypothetical protein
MRNHNESSVVVQCSRAKNPDATIGRVHRFTQHGGMVYLTDNEQSELSAFEFGSFALLAVAGICSWFRKGRHPE